MFSDRKKTKKENSFARDANKIAEETVFTGDIESSGSFRIEGKVKGDLKVAGKVVIGETGKVIGDIECAEADIAGILEGKAIITNNLVLKATSSVNGDLISAELTIESGAVFNGSSTMKGAVKSLAKNESKEKSKKRKGKTA